MTDSMTIGPALTIGGNKVEMLQTGNILVTSPKGKMKTLSQDEFKKQLVKNINNINNGENFEFKKDNKKAKIAAGIGATLAAAYIGLSIAVGKKVLTKATAKAGEKLGLTDKIKNVFFTIGNSGVKLWDSILVKASQLKNKITDKSKALQEKRYATYSKEQASKDAHRYFAANADTINLSQAKRETAIADARAAFEKYDPIKFLKAKVLEEAGLTKEQYSAVKKYANTGAKATLTDARKKVLPNWIQDKESCQRYANMIEAKFIKARKVPGTK